MAESRRDRITVTLETLTPYQAASIAYYEKVRCNEQGVIRKVKWETWDNRDNGSGEYASTVTYLDSNRNLDEYLSLYSSNEIIRLDLPTVDMRPATTIFEEELKTNSSAEEKLRVNKEFLDKEKEMLKTAFENALIAERGNPEHADGSGDDFST